MCVYAFNYAMPPVSKGKRKASKGKKYEEEYEKYTCDELRQKLLELGENPGPIDASNKYIRYCLHMPDCTTVNGHVTQNAISTQHATLYGQHLQGYVCETPGEEEGQV